MYIRSVVRGLVAAGVFSMSLVILLLPSRAAAVAAGNANDFTVTNFTAEEWLDNTDPQGQLHVIEHITVDFRGNNHGILRAIPDSYKGTSLHLVINGLGSDTGAPTPYSTSRSNGNTVLKIGEASTTVTGAQEYTIDYTVHNVISFYKDHDELYWDINGDQWEQPFDHVAVRLHVPSGLKLQRQACYAGSYGSTDQMCAINADGGVVTAATTAALGGRQTLTIVAGFAKGYFTAPSLTDWLREHMWQILAIVGAPLVIGGYAFARWHKYGRDPKDRGVIIPEYEQPDKLSPAEVLAIYKFSLPVAGVTATIIDLAVRKYIKIYETKVKKLLKDETSYTLELLKPVDDMLRDHERQIIGGLFGAGAQTGTQVVLKDLKSKFYKTSQSVQKSVPKGLTAAGYVAGNPVSAGGRLYVLGSISMFLAFILHSLASVGFAIAGGLAFLFGYFMPRRTAAGVVALEKIKGLKLYMETVEKDRMAMLQSPNAPYAALSPEPTKTVDLFEKLLPFAIVLGVESQWAKQFESIYTTPPDWYAGDWATFNAVYFASSLNHSISAMNTSFAPPSNSSSSGFGGGGFAGGGGGGGGGGGW